MTPRHAAWAESESDTESSEDEEEAARQRAQWAAERKAEEKKFEEEWVRDADVRKEIERLHMQPWDWPWPNGWPIWVRREWEDLWLK